MFPAASDQQVQQFEAMRPRLFGIAYRMLQTREDAEEVVQDAWLRLASADGVESVEGFVLRVTTRLCLDREKSARRRRETYVGPWLADLVDTSRTPDEETEQIESLNLGLLHVLLTLPPLERAVFLLREAFDYPYDRIAEVVGRRPDACRQIARRARHHVRSEDVERSVDREAHEQLLAAFLEAAEKGEAGRLEGLLAEDVVLISDGGGKVVSATRPIGGRTNVARFLVGISQKAPAGTTVSFRQVNGVPGAEVRIEGRVAALFTLQVAKGRIRRVFVVRNPEKLSALE